jgi:hypothetical protein
MRFNYVVAHLRRNYFIPFFSNFISTPILPPSLVLNHQQEQAFANMPMSESLGNSWVEKFGIFLRSFGVFYSVC